MSDIPVQCCRCKNKHMETDRICKPVKSAGPIAMSELLCPKCSAKSFFDLTPQLAWCWSSGLIEFGSAMPANEKDGAGAIKVATGPAAFLKGQLAVFARHGYIPAVLLVPGVPEAKTPQEKVTALSAWLKFCARGNGKKNRHGVQFSQEGAPL